TNDSIKIGDTLHFKGNTTDFEQLVESMQIDRVDVNEAGIGKDVGIKVHEKVRKKDKVYKVEK
ncbi:MAG: translation elongation factor-like protein, partial [Deltaproteobacteria bacterium]|nr:translation elongation factor-like protein [Deltaproteobacteria bacterium]